MQQAISEEVTDFVASIAESDVEMGAEEGKLSLAAGRHGVADLARLISACFDDEKLADAPTLPNRVAGFVWGYAQARLRT